MTTGGSRGARALTAAVLAVVALAGCGPVPSTEPAQPTGVDTPTSVRPSPPRTPATTPPQTTAATTPARPSVSSTPEAPPGTGTTVLPGAVVSTCSYTVRDHGSVHAESVQCVVTGGGGIVIVNSSQVVVGQG